MICQGRCRNIDIPNKAIVNREPHFARLVPNDEVGSKQNNYNLSVSAYVEQEDTREKIDIVKLNAEIAEIVAREQKLREETDRIIGEIEGTYGG